MNNNKYLIKQCVITSFGWNKVWYREEEIIQECAEAEYNELYNSAEISWGEDFESFKEGDEFYSYWNYETGSWTISKELDKSYLNK